MPTKASRAANQITLAPDQLPLPELPPDLNYELVVAVADARLKLYAELDSCWAGYFPKDVVIEDGRRPIVHFVPERFFEPFVAYAVTFYEAYARVLMKLRPTLSDLEAWLNFLLRTLVCDELAPFRSSGASATEVLNHRPSQWQAHMHATWRLFEHPHRQRLFDTARELTNALEDSMEPHREHFVSAVHNAISRRTLPLAIEGLKQLGSGAIVQQPAQPQARSKDKSERSKLVVAFLLACNREPHLATKIIKKHIWLSVGHKTPRQFQYWQAGKSRRPGQTHGATEQDDQNFERILKMAPADFVALIKKQATL